MRDRPVEIVTSPHSLVLREVGALSTEHQNLLRQIKEREETSSHLVSDPGSPLSQINPMIYVAKKHNYHEAMRNLELSQDKLIGAQLIAASKK
mmetsp:Transcript_41243/g.54197  ORF Transcript_41243/g.54197 Transcript_41243/m.54197 type:complete len:93 (-) Transcript_41243:2053-2331(-)